MLITRTLSACASIALLALASACGTAFVHPAAVSDSLAQDPGLVGEWECTGPTFIHAVIGRPVGGLYPVTLTVRQKGAQQTSLSLDLSLTDIAGDRYADLFLSRTDRDKLVSTYGFLALPVHQIMKISRSFDQLEVWSFNGAWIEGVARSGGYSHDRVTVGGGEISMTTATTDQLRELIARQGHDPKAFGDPTIFHRSGPR